MTQHLKLEVAVALLVSIFLLAGLALIGVRGEPGNSGVIAPLYSDADGRNENAPTQATPIPTTRAGSAVDILDTPAPLATPTPVRTPMRVASTPTPISVVVSSTKREFVYYRGPATYVRTDAFAPLALASLPRPLNDNGRGLHWFPTTYQSHAVVDRFVPELTALRMRWVVVLQGMNDWDLVANDYLVDRLQAAGIVPVLRIVMQVGEPDYRRLGWLVARYRERGVRYFQLFNEPNEAQEWTAAPPHTPERFASFWLQAAQVTAANGGLPGLAPLSPHADVSDLAFFTAALSALKEADNYGVLNQTWVAVHNYGGLAASGFWRYRQYDAAVKNVFGGSLPIIVTEGGLETAVATAQVIAPMYGFVEREREPYLLAFAPWLIGNGVSGGHDSRWEPAAWFTGTLDRVQPSAVIEQVK